MSRFVKKASKKSDKLTSNTYSTFANESEDNVTFKFVQKCNKTNTEMYDIKLPSTSRIKYKGPGKRSTKKRIKDWFKKRCLCCCLWKRKHHVSKTWKASKNSDFKASYKDAPSSSSSMVTLPLTPSREATLRRTEDCKWKDVPKTSSFLGDIIDTKDKFLERLEYDRSIPRKKKGKDQSIFLVTGTFSF